ncbi:MAG TPA: DNA polymerase III subunit alpha [Pseudothermotoga sp.]
MTSVDPIKYDLLFERFLNEYRQELPDIDIDVEDEKRAFLIEKLSEEFAFVAQISTFATLSPKSLQNESKRLGIKITSKTFDLLNGLPFHRSTHAAGVVIADSVLPLPIVPNTKPFLLEYDMDSLSKIGVTKIDILGLTTLSLLHKLKKSLDLKEIPVNDSLVYKEISSGRTHGVFQLERLSARSLCRQIRPQDIKELSDLLAVNRPGPLLAKLNELYAERKRGCGKRDRFFEETYGVMIYQEQLMKIAADLAGMTPAESDLFRKAISQKDSAVMKDAAEQFKRRAIDKGYDRSLIEQLVEIILRFSSYGFNKSHSIAYAYISYELAYIKHHFPKEFFTIYLKEHSSDREKIFLSVQELRSRGFRVIHPSINPIKLKDNEFQLPLEVIAGVSNSIANMCITKGPFSSIDDFARKTSIPISTLQRFVFAGAFDCLYSTREESIKAFNAFQKGYDPSLVEISSIFGEHHEEKVLKFTQKDIATFEEQVYGFPLTPLQISFQKTFAPLTEVFVSGRTLPVSLLIDSNFASDSVTIVRIKGNLPDGEYLCVVKPDCSIDEYHDLSRVDSVVYEPQNCFDHMDFEPASERETVKVKLLDKKVYIDSTRPLLDHYKINITLKNV